MNFAWIGVSVPGNRCHRLRVPTPSSAPLYVAVAVTDRRRCWSRTNSLAVGGVHRLRGQDRGLERRLLLLPLHCTLHLSAAAVDAVCDIAAVLSNVCSLCRRPCVTPHAHSGDGGMVGLGVGITASPPAPACTSAVSHLLSVPALPSPPPSPSLSPPLPSMVPSTTPLRLHRRPAIDLGIGSSLTLLPY